MNVLPGQRGFFDMEPPAIDKASLPPVWLGFSLDHDDQAVRADFRRRFGQDPAELRRVPGLKLAGPVPDM